MIHFHHKHDHGSLAEGISGSGAARIRRTVAIGCVINAILMGLKLSVGYLGHSDALMADGFHSLNDFAADLIMLLFVGISYRPADDRYAYGYGKFETFSSFMISVFLCIIAVMIGAEAIENLVDYAQGVELPQPDVSTVIVVLVAIAAKECLYRFYSSAGRKANSQALKANAWHHRSDALSSVATLIGVTMAHFMGPEWRVLDPAVSILIGIFILVAAVRMLVPAFNELMERSAGGKETAEALKLVGETPGVERVESLRSRRSGHYFIFDVRIEIPRNLTIDQGAEIAKEVGERLRKRFGEHTLVSVETAPFEG